MTEQTIPAERWLPVPGHEGVYQVSDRGRVRSVDRVSVSKSRGAQKLKGKMLRQTSQKSGHLYVDLCTGGKPKHCRVHRLVLEAFVGPAPAGTEACHADDNPANNHLKNLRWDSLSENRFDRVRNGRHHQSIKTHCLRGHALAEPNLVKSQTRHGHRGCLSCSRARGRIRKNPGLRSDLQEISDQYYARITKGQTVLREGWGE